MTEHSPLARSGWLRSRWLRAALLAPGGVALLLGLNAGLQRLDVAAVLSDGRVASAHGALMVLGFVGTLIALERAVATGRAWAYLSPAFLGLGGIASVLPVHRAIGPALTTVGAAALIAVYVPLYRRQRDPSVAIQAAGAAFACGGAVMLTADVSFPLLLPWLAAFVVLTIVGERLELARIAVLTPIALSALLMIVAAYAVGTALTLTLPELGYPLLGASTIVLVGWLFRFDIAMKTIRGTGLPRFTAACLLAGYAWLACAAGIWLLSSAEPTGAAYDAAVHAVFLGFTMSMIMAHAPIIFPAVLRHSLPYTAAFYAPAALLHASVLVRVAIGDAADSLHARELGGILNVAAVLLFALTAAASMLLHDRGTA